MSYDVNKLFISKIIQEQDFPEVAAIPSYYLTDPDYRRAFEYIREYYGTYAQCPTLRTFQSDCDVPLVHVDEPWSDIKERLVATYKHSILVRNYNDVASLLDSGRIDDVVNLLSSTVADIHAYAPSSRDVDVTTNGDERLGRYAERKERPGHLVGVPTGFPTIDKATQGVQPGQLIVVTGLPKSSKSTIGLVMGMSIQEYGKRVLYLTYEMTVEEQEVRIDAYRAGFNDNLLNSGMYSASQFQDLKRAIHKTENLPPMLISQDCMTVGEIASKIDTFHPDVVIVDGVYMMDDERGEKRGSPNALANIVNSLKNLAMRRMISIIAITQSTPARTKGEELNSDSMMGSRSFAQYANVVIGIERTQDVMCRKLKILLSRSCPPCEVMLLCDYDTGTFEEWENYDMDTPLDDVNDEIPDDQNTQALY